MRISAEFIEQVKDRNPIDEVMRSYVTLRRAGRILTCLCPFHSEKTPSCAVYTDSESFYCFGCHAGGDVITFIMKIESLDYIEAIRFLAQRAGLAMPEDGYDDRLGQEKKRLSEINKEAARFFYKNLSSQDGRVGLEYLIKKRHLRPETIKSFGLGVAVNRWTDLKNHMLALGYSEHELIKASLLSEKNGRTFDFFVNRVIFPIFDLRGNVIAFSGRTLEQNPSGGKYLNSRETVLYKKSKTLYALNFAKNESVKSKRLILCEGNVDVISLHQAGFKEAVATCGTAITGEHARIMSQYCDEVYICYDSDAAGVKATQNAIQILSEAGLPAKVVRLSGNGVKDVDDYINKFGQDHFKVLLSGSEGSTEYELSSAKSGLDTKDDLGKVEYLKRAVKILAGIDSRIEREIYISRVASEQGIPKDAISAEVEALLRKNHRQEDKRWWRQVSYGTRRDSLNPEAVKYPKLARAEESIIAYILSNPAEADNIFSKLSPEKFVTSFNKRVYEELVKIRSSGTEIGLTTLGGKLSPDEMGKISGILANTREIPITSDVAEECITILQEFSGDDDGSDWTDEELSRYVREKGKR